MACNLSDEKGVWANLPVFICLVIMQKTGAVKPLGAWLNIFSKTS
jgi:hypothetical protein